MTGSPPLPAGFLDRPFAHRGLHGPGAAENSRAAIRAAVDAGYGIEIDLQPASDGTPMVFHDAELDRMTEATGLVTRLPPAALAELAVRGGDGEGIPTLARVLETVAGRAPLLIEMKDQSGDLGPGPQTFEPALAVLLAGYGGPVAVMSFNPEMAAALAELAPDIPRGLTTCGFTAADWPHVPEARARRLAQIGDAERVGAAFISHDHRDLGRAAVARQRDAGRRVLCWTIRNPGEEAAALCRADAVTFEGYRPLDRPSPRAT